ncbi:hypothetical protein DPX16_0455 [Anabarilius grahami]|uniref:AAA+ ATPase domain-containing protein n=1 Tax=Anabarilius grahami TaxID=495550 RepID=A0A3N0Z2E8_ANAGA|nr:hypothetical protein DPX16_0455 [Anabarilius grahami]
MASLRPELNNIMKQSEEIEHGTSTRYILKPKIKSNDESESYRKMIFGERNKNKPHKIILMVGETGTGKTTLLNTMINYMLGVQREDKVWFQISDDQSDRTSAHSQTSKITVYGFYPQESKTDLTIIDTPGYGDTRGADIDKEIAESLFSFNKSEGINELHAVCLVIKASQNRLTDRQIYIFDSVQSLFGRDIIENILLLFTYSNGRTPKNALTAVKEAKIKSAVNDKNQPVFFLFDNCQSEADDEDDDEDNDDQSWNLSFKEMGKFFKFLETIKPKSLEKTQDVLQKRKQLEANISNLQSRVHLTELKRNELKQTQEALEQNREQAQQNKNFEYEVEVPYKERVNINPAVASAAVCCTVCKENCHYPGCWWFTRLSWCEVMKNSRCTVCTNRCALSEHVKEAKIYVTKTKRVKKTYDDLKQKYDEKIGNAESLGSLVKKLEKELQELEEDKIKLVNESVDCVETLQKIALNTDSLITLLHADFLIEKLKEINEPEKAKKLEEMKKKAGEEKKGALGYFKSLFKM